MRVYEGKVVGIAKSFSKTFYKSKAWQRCREGYIQSVFGLCERCQKPGLIVHHKELLTPMNINDPNITLNWNLLEYLCLECHNKEHTQKYYNTANGLMFNDDGELIQV